MVAAKRKPVSVTEAMTKADYEAARKEHIERTKAEIAATETEAERQKRLYREQRARERGELG